MLSWARPIAYITCATATAYHYGKMRTKQKPEGSRSHNSADWTSAEQVNKSGATEEALKCTQRGELIDLVLNSAPCQLAMNWTASE